MTIPNNVLWFQLGVLLVLDEEDLPREPFKLLQRDVPDDFAVTIVTLQAFLEYLVQQIAAMSFVCPRAGFLDRVGEQLCVVSAKVLGDRA